MSLDSKLTTLVETMADDAGATGVERLALREKLLEFAENVRDAVLDHISEGQGE